jgi:hypothetical protein
MEEGLLERGETAYPHLRRREGVHPKDETGAVGVGVGLDADLADFLGGGEERFEFQRKCEALGFHETVNDGLGVGGDLLERAGAIEMLRTADEPEFGSGEVYEGHGSLRERGGVLVTEGTERGHVGHGVQKMRFMGSAL